MRVLNVGIEGPAYIDQRILLGNPYMLVNIVFLCLSRIVFLFLVKHGIGRHFEKIIPLLNIILVTSRGRYKN